MYQDKPHGLKDTTNVCIVTFGSDQAQTCWEDIKDQTYLVSGTPYCNFSPAKEHLSCSQHENGKNTQIVNTKNNTNMDECKLRAGTFLHG